MTLVRPALSAIVVHWHCEADLEALLTSWPDDPGVELVIVDNGSSEALDDRRCLILTPSRNLGFAGAVNFALARTKAPLILILNPDTRPLAGTLAALVEGFARWPDAAGLAPRMIGSDGRGQHRWQLRRVPSLASLLLQCAMVPAGAGPREEPQPGAPIEQAAAAALALRREVLDELGGFDESFYPAWFEDVDLAARLQRTGRIIRYCPAAVFEHRLGASISRLGYRRFLWIYYVNLSRYLRKHHGATWGPVVRLVLVLAAAGRLLALPLRRPRRATTRREAARALLTLMLGAASGWRLPANWSSGAAGLPGRPA